jgi:hypothetical protein
MQWIGADLTLDEAAEVLRRSRGHVERAGEGVHLVGFEAEEGTVRPIDKADAAALQQKFGLEGD